MDGSREESTRDTLEKPTRINKHPIKENRSQFIAPLNIQIGILQYRYPIKTTLHHRLWSIPREKRHVSETSAKRSALHPVNERRTSIPGLEKMSSSASDGKEHEHARRGNIRPAEEGIFTADPGNSGDDDRLCPMVRQHGEVY